MFVSILLSFSPLEVHVAQKLIEMADSPRAIPPAGPYPIVRRAGKWSLTINSKDGGGESAHEKD
jgi:hypothetical protein